MTTAAPSTALATIQPALTDPERLALAGYLAGYRGLTREAYALGLRQFTSWCRARCLGLFAVRRADIESFARDLEAKGRTQATVTRRLSTIAGFYRYAVEEELLDHSPAAHVRRPRVDYESHAAALDRNELGALLVAAGLGPPAEHSLISLLALNGLRVSEATGADIDHLGLERGHRTLTITRKGGKVVTIALAPRTARAIDLAIGERTGGPVFLAADGRRLDRHGAGRVVRKVARRAGIGKAVTPHTLRHAFITAALDAGVPLPRGGDVEAAGVAGQAQRAAVDAGPPVLAGIPARVMRCQVVDQRGIDGEVGGASGGEQPFVPAAGGVGESARVDRQPPDGLCRVQQHPGPGGTAGGVQGIRISDPPVRGLHRGDRDQRGAEVTDSAIRSSGTSRTRIPRPDCA
jgi:integrase/recombinase XerD